MLEFLDRDYLHFTRFMNYEGSKEPPRTGFAASWTEENVKKKNVKYAKKCNFLKNNLAESKQINLS
jgi:hypothetical protein